MPRRFNRELVTYYNERAHEYDMVYRGRHPAIDKPDLYVADVDKITRLVSRFGSGDIIDIGCGTGYWLPHYHHNASHITLVDASENMLAVCKQRAAALKCEDMCDFIQADFFTMSLERDDFNSAVIGFMLSHIPQHDVQVFFRRLKTILQKRSEVLIIDSVWGPLRQLQRKKEGMQERTLNDGRVFSIYKRYFTPDELCGILEQQGIVVTSSYVGDVFMAMIGEWHA